MKVKDRETGLILESKNEFVTQQWLKHPEKYIQPKSAAVAAAPVPVPVKKKK